MTKFRKFKADQKIGRRSAQNLEEEEATKGELEQTYYQTPFNIETTVTAGDDSIPRTCSNATTAKNNGMTIALKATANFAVSFATVRTADNFCIS